jgi:predicted 3-demethylubiquinone-9 3-methyltransferase (glyoxalase superfamily)
MQKIKPCLWFNDNAEEAAQFYTSLFPNSRTVTSTKYNAESSAASGRPEGSVMSVIFELAGQSFMGLNGGPIFKFTPAVSFFVACSDEAEIDSLYAALSDGGFVMMELAEHSFAKKYAWVSDRFGVSWQLILRDVPQKIAPCLMFTGPNFGKAKEAMAFYTSLFANSKIETVHEYGPGEPVPQGAVAHARFVLNGYAFAVTESSLDHGFNFSEAISFMVDCESQKEIDFFWSKLSEGGAPSQCGWLTDKFGIAWQIIPAALNEIMQSGDEEKKHRTMAALMKMTKLDIAALQNA